MNFSKYIKLKEKIISKESKVFIIAEAGINHNGSISNAKKLIDIAVKAKVDAVKFQTFKTESLILKNVSKAPYQKKINSSAENQFTMLKKLEISKDEILELAEYCHSKGIIFLITPFDEDALEELNDLDLAAIKIASTDTTNIPFLLKVAKKNKPIILSTGMTYYDEIKMVLEILEPINPQIILLQCTADYPTDPCEVNLSVLHRFAIDFNILTGFSDHTTGIGASPYAIPFGAKIIEKHFTIDKNMVGPDHRASLSPEELIKFVSIIRDVEKMIGIDIKQPTISESKNRKSLQKCLVSKQSINKGDEYTSKNLTAKRTGGTGISPIYYFDILGKKANKNYKENEIIDDK